MATLFNRGKYSHRGQGPGSCIDGLAISPLARRKHIVLNSTAPLIVQAATKYMSYIIPNSLGGSWTVVEAWAMFCVIPVAAGATSTWSIRKCATDGTTFTTLVTGVTTLTGYTTFVPVALTLANTTATVSAGQSIIVTATTDNTAVSTADVGACITLLMEPVESEAIAEDNILVAPG